LILSLRRNNVGAETAGRNQYFFPKPGNEVYRNGNPEFLTISPQARWSDVADGFGRRPIRISVGAGSAPRFCDRFATQTFRDRKRVKFPEHVAIPGRKMSRTEFEAILSQHRWDAHPFHPPGSCAPMETGAGINDQSGTLSEFDEN
jgi:hypothetical protein